MKTVIAIISMLTGICLFANETNSDNTFEYKNETLRIRISRDSVNRIVLPSNITGKILSSEKGLNVQYSGREAYIKANPIKRTDFVGNKVAKSEIEYADRDAEVFFLTEKRTYAVVFVPAKIDTRTVYIVDNANASLEVAEVEKHSREYVKNIKEIFKLAISSELGKSFTEVVKNEKYDDFYFVSQFDGNQYVVFKFYLVQDFTTDVLKRISKSIKHTILADAVFERNYYVLGVKNE